MTSPFSDYTISQCFDLYFSHPSYDKNPPLYAPSEDLVVGLKKKITLQIKGNETMERRDVFIWGKLSVKSADRSKATLKLRNLFLDGRVKTTNAEIVADKIYNKEEARQQLQNIVVDWFLHQRDDAKKMRLQSAFIGPYFLKRTKNRVLFTAIPAENLNENSKVESVAQAIEKRSLYHLSKINS